MKRWLSLVTVLAIAGGIVVGVSSVVGERSPLQRQSAPSLAGPSPDPCRGPFEIGEPNPPAQSCPELEVAGEDYTAPGIPGGQEHIADQVTVKGKTVPLPPDTRLQIGVETPHPCSPDQSPQQVAVAALLQGGQEVSWVKFSLNGILLESRIQPQHEDLLAPLLKALGPPGPPPPDYCVTIRGEIVPLPPGATLSTPIVEPGPGYTGPLQFTVVRLGESWLSFTDGTLLESSVLPQHEAELKPLLDKLTPQ